MQFIPFNSRDIRHKSVFGSTAAGESLWLSVVMPRDMGVCAVYLVAGKDGEQKNYYNLEWKSTDNHTEWWSINYTFEREGLYFYHFEYDTPYGRGRIFLHSGGMGQFSDSGREWQQTVFLKDFKTPDKFKGGVMYQIFPDRFCFSGQKKDNIPADRIIKNWGDEVKWQKDEDGIYRCNDYFCGDFKGIENSLDYLENSGVNCIYLNPVFEAHSNHRYNTGDYMKTDPMLGTEEDFVSLCRSAKEHGIYIILDGVFSHTGDDSIYFNRYGRYNTKGAYHNKQSEYYDWYTFTRDGKYKSWWGFETLPEINELNEKYTEFITGENGVIAKWLRLGADGFRLDVADELPDAFIEKIRTAVKREKSDALLIGEVWEDASNKFSMGERRKYFLGRELDSVMNYPFRNAIIDFMLNGIAEEFSEKIVTVCENYPFEVLNCLMNSLSTHDTERIFSVLGGQNGENKSRELQYGTVLNEKQCEQAEKLLLSAVTLQFTLPGIPCIYYGDENYMQGLKDPFNRRCFIRSEKDTAVSVLIKKLAGIRKTNRSLKDGKLNIISAMLGCVAFERRSEDNNCIVVISNMNRHEITYYLPEKYCNCVPLTNHKVTDCSVIIPAKSTVILKLSC